MKSLGCRDRNTEQLEIWKPFELFLNGDELSIRPRRHFQSKETPFCPSICDDYEGNKLTVIDAANIAFKTDDAWFCYEIGQNNSPVIRYIVENWNGTREMMPSSRMEWWCRHIVAWLMDKIESKDDWYLVACWGVDELPRIDWRCLTHAMAGYIKDDITAQQVDNVLSGRVSGLTPELLTFKSELQIQGLVTTRRHGRVEKGEMLLGPQSHSECRVLWLEEKMDDLDKLKPFGAKIAQAIGPCDTWIYMVHPGGNAGGHIMMYPKKKVHMMLPFEVPTKVGRRKPRVDVRGIKECGIALEYTHYFCHYIGSKAMNYPYLLTRKGRDGEYVRGAFADGVDVHITPLGVDLLREVCSMLRILNSIYQRDSKGRNGRVASDGICSRIPFASSWHNLVTELPAGFELWLLQYYADLLLNGGTSISYLTLIDYHTSKNSIDGQCENFITSKDSIIASLLYRAFIGNESDRRTRDGRAMENFQYHQPLLKDRLIISNAFRNTGISIEWPTCMFHDI
jgi:hypothetical protein